MPIYEVRPDGLNAVAPTSFQTIGFRERGDIQRLLEAQIECLDEDLMVLTEEFSGWLDSSRRIDLLCLDSKANLVVVELKRDEDGGHMELQALRYAAMVSAMTFEQAVAALAAHRRQDEVAARAAILTHLGWATPEENAFAQETRIILAAADFGKEITTTVLWLRERYEVDVRCVRLRPHRMADGRILLDIQTLIPLPEAEAFQTQIGAKKAAEQKERSDREALLARFLDQLAATATVRTDLHKGRTPDAKFGVLYGPYRAGFTLNYVVAKDRSRAELLIQRDDGRDQLLRLKQSQTAIEEAFGSSLEWQEKEGVRQCRIFHPVEGGYRSPEADWPELHERLIGAMIRLDAALRPQVAQFR